MLDSRTRTAVGVGVALLIFGGGVLVGHGTTSDSSTGSAPAPAPSGAIAPPPSSAAGLGASRAVSGIPVGYPHTKSGALSAAANYTAALGSPAVLTAEGRTAVVAAIASKDSAGSVGQSLDAAKNGALDQLRTDAAGKVAFGMGTVPLALKVDGQYTDQSVTVKVYAMTYLASSSATAASAYGQGTVRLAWDGSDWKLTGYSTAPASGPVPVGYYSPSTGWQPTNGQSLYDVSANFRQTLTEGTVPGYVVP